MVGVTISKDRAGNDITKIRTFNARKDVGSLITDEKVLYLNEDKKRTQEWFQACGIQVPLGGTQFGFIRSISQKNEKYNSKNRKSIKATDSEFSLANNVEETKDLVAVHGMTIQNLMSSLELGGLLMPSIAISKARMGHNRYGDVSLNADGTLYLRTAGHECFHIIEEWNPAAAQELKDKVINYLQQSKEYDYEAQVEKYAERYGVKSYTADGLELIHSEMAADCMFDVFSNEHFITELVSEDKTLAQKVKDFLSKFISDLRSMMKHFTASPELNALREQTEVLEDINKSFKTALEAASTKMQESLKNEQKNNASRTDITEKAGNGVQGEGVRYSFIGLTKDGRRVYTSDLDKNMPETERVSLFKKRIATIFNLGAVELKTDVKKISIRGDKFTAQKNLYGDLYKLDSEGDAKINALYDLADILATSKYIPSATGKEPSYANPSIEPKNKAHKGVKYWYKFKNEIVFDGVPYTVTFSIRDKGTEQYQYLIEFKENKTPGLSNTVVKNLLRTDQMPYTNNVSQNSAGVNSNSMQKKGRNSKNRNSYKSTESNKIDSEYLYAVESGDMETAQKLVDAAAKNAGYTIKAYHGTPNGNFTVFDAKKIGSNTDSGIFGSGFYFTTHEDTAGVYATESGHIMPVYLKVNNPWWAVSHRNIQEVAEELGMDETAFALRGYGGKGRIVTPTMSQTGQFSEHLQEHGYDAVVVQHGSNNYEVVVFDSNIIKSADTVTYDDNGKIIPLSERFKDDKKDIRYSLKLSSAGEKLVQSSPELQMVFKDLQRQTKLSNGYIPEAKKIHSYAYELKKTCQSTLNVAEIENDLRNIYEVLSSMDDSEGYIYASGLTAELAEKLLYKQKTPFREFQTVEKPCFSNQERHGFLAFW